MRPALDLTRVIQLTLALALYPVSGGAQSFDCAKATTVSETAICNNAELRGLDTRMGALFVARAAENPVVRVVQREWIGKRDSYCQAHIVERCLAVTIRARTDELSSSARAASFTLPPLPPSAMVPKPAPPAAPPVRTQPEPVPEQAAKPQDKPAADCPTEIRAWDPQSGRGNRAFDLSQTLRLASRSGADRAYRDFEMCVQRQRRGDSGGFCGCEFHVLGGRGGSRNREFFEVKFRNCDADDGSNWASDLERAYRALTCHKTAGWPSLR